MYRQKIADMGRPVANKFKVPKKQWDKWSNQARSVFNKLYDAMRPTMQWVFSHPEMLPLPKEHWGTLRWNAAWEAACIVNGSAPGRLMGVMMNGKKYTQPPKVKHGKEGRRFGKGTRAAGARKRVSR